MKRHSLIIGVAVAILTLLVNPSYGQKKVTEKKLLGTWKLVIDIEEALEEAKDEEESILGEIILQGVSGLVEGVMENIDIMLEFKKGGELRIIVEAFGEEEVDYGNWRINSRGELLIDDGDNTQFDDDDYWLMEGNRLISFEQGNRYPEENVFMTKIE